MNIHQILYQLYLLGYRTGEIAAEMDNDLTLTPPAIGHLLSSKNRIAAMVVMAQGYDEGKEGDGGFREPMEFASFDMHVLEALDYDY